MLKKPPHILVTTPESLYILLTSDGGRRILGTIKTVIVDEIHSLARDKRGSHLALSLERLDALAGAENPLQRIGLSATQKPLEDVARFLVGVGRECTLVDAGHLRDLDLAIEIPPSPLSAVCSHEVWEEIYERMADLVREHRTTLVFVNTRKWPSASRPDWARARREDDAAKSAGRCLSPRQPRPRAGDAEQRLSGQPKVLVRPPRSSSASTSAMSIW
jgi:ATP-dependent Lhr-like helicase